MHAVFNTQCLKSTHIDLWPSLSLVLRHIIRNTSSRNGRRWPEGHDYNFMGK